MLWSSLSPYVFVCVFFFCYCFFSFCPPSSPRLLSPSCHSFSFLHPNPLFPLPPLPMISFCISSSVASLSLFTLFFFSFHITSFPFHASLQFACNMMLFPSGTLPLCSFFLSFFPPLTYSSSCDYFNWIILLFFSVLHLDYFHNSFASFFLYIFLMFFLFTIHPPPQTQPPWSSIISFYQVYFLFIFLAMPCSLFALVFQPSFHYTSFVCKLLFFFFSSYALLYTLHFY